MLRLSTISWHTFISSTLRPGAWVIDLGANRGSFAHAIADRFGVRCLAVEPVPALYAAIDTSVHVAKAQFAVCPTRGPVTLHVSRRDDASSLLSLPADDLFKAIVVEGTDLESLLETHDISLAQIALLKLDIEGAETSVLAALSNKFLVQVPQISIEFHDFCGLVSSDAVHATLQRLTSLGYRCLRFSRRTHENVLCVNQCHIPLGRIAMWRIRLITRLLLQPWWALKTRIISPSLLSRFASGPTSPMRRPSK